MYVSYLPNYPPKLAPTQICLLLYLSYLLFLIYSKYFLFILWWNYKTNLHTTYPQVPTNKTIKSVNRKIKIHFYFKGLMIKQEQRRVYIFCVVINIWHEITWSTCDYSMKHDVQNVHHLYIKKMELVCNQNIY